MIGQFNPFVVFNATGFIVTPGTNIIGNPVNVRATSAATELANDIQWFIETN